MMHMSMDYPLLGAAPGNTYGRMLLDIMKRQLVTDIHLSVPVLVQDSTKHPSLVMTTIVRVVSGSTLNKE